MKIPTAPVPSSALSLLRAGCLSLLVVLFCGPATAALLASFYNFVDVAVPNPTTTARVKAAIVNGALLQTWVIVENPDGSLTATLGKVRQHELKMRITYDAERYSVVYLDSSGLDYTVKYTDGLQSDVELSKFQYYDAKLTESMRPMPEFAFAVKTEGYMHPASNARVRELLAAVRRELLAPLGR